MGLAGLGLLAVLALAGLVALVLLGRYAQPPQALVVAGLNGDGRPDLLTSDESHTLELRLGNGRGGFEPRRLTVLVHTDPQALAVSDVDGDGDLDLLAPSMTVADTCRATAGLWRNDGHAGFGLAQDVPIGNCGSPGAVLADVDGDAAST